MPLSLLAGLAAGSVLGFLGAGGAVVGLPILFLSSSLGTHAALGTNALDVALIAGVLFAWRWRSGEARLAPTVALTLPGLAGVWVGTRVGLVEPGHRLVFLLGFVLLAVAGWMLYLSMRPGDQAARGAGPTWRAGLALAVLGMLVGGVSGFFAVGGGFMIVPALMVVGGLELGEATASALLPIAAFTALVGVQYLRAGYIDYTDSAYMLAGGAVGGVVGVTLARHLPKRVVQRCFAAALSVIGVYFFLR